MSTRYGPKPAARRTRKRPIQQRSLETRKLLLTSAYELLERDPSGRLTTTALADFTRDGVHVAVRHGLGQYPGLHSERILAVEIVPVAAPALVRKLGMPATPADLLRWPQVHDTERKGWHLWFQAQGIDEIERPRGPSFDDSSLLWKAVMAGQGAGLLPAAMVSRELADGSLVRLADVTLLDAFAYYLVYPEESHARAKIAAFREWILGEAGRAGSS